MTIIWLQVWGGSGYLINKFLFSRAERCSIHKRQNTIRIWSWLIYLLALPAWLAVFALEGNWIAAAVELGGVPSMILGLIAALKEGKQSEMKWMNSLASVFVIIGILLSVVETHGTFKLTQLTEIGIAVGFLLGTYHLAKNHTTGYLWLMLGNLSCAALMALESLYLLMFQQLLSLFFVADAYFVRKKNDARMAVADQPVNSLRVE